MQDKLLCKFNLFDLDQKIYLYSSVKNKVIEIGTCATENVGDMIVSLLINKPSIGEIELSVSSLVSIIFSIGGKKPCIWTSICFLNLKSNGFNCNSLEKDDSLSS